METANGNFSLSSQCYAPEVIGGDGAERIEAFGWEPWPHWIFKLEDGTRIELEIFGVKGEPTTCLSWKLLGPRKDVKLHVRPFLSGRDYHSLHKSNPGFRFDAEVMPDRVSWQPYNDVPGVTALTNPERAALAARGRYLFAVASCAMCHGPDGSGGLKVSWLPFGTLWVRNVTPTRLPASAAGAMRKSRAPSGRV